MAKPKISDNASLPERLGFYASPAGNPGDCILWVGALDKDGYGIFQFHRKGLKAHRTALSLRLGRALTRKEYALHRCHNRRCLNPDHLYVGNQHDNMRDMIVAGRKVVRCGSSHYNTRFTERQLAAIMADTRRRKIVMAEYGVSATHYHRIKKGHGRVTSPV